MRYDFASDNTAGLAPEALEALVGANCGFSRPYGEDEVSRACADAIRQRLDCDAEIRFLSSGTAANALALTLLARPFEAIAAHRLAHIIVDEGGAPGLLGQGLGLVPLSGPSAKLSLEALKGRLKEPEQAHAQPLAAVSISQISEYGARWTEEEVRALSRLAREHGLGLHVDGARLANACAAGFDARVLSGLVDVLVFGGAKAGAGTVEAIVVFDRALARRIDNRVKQIGQLVSKGRCMAAPLLGLLSTGAWDARAAHANAMARRLAERIAPQVRTAHPVEGNMVFLELDGARHQALWDMGWAANRYEDGSLRLVTSWATTPESVDAIAADITSL